MQEWGRVLTCAVFAAAMAAAAACAPSVREPPAPAPVATFRDCNSCPEMVVVPAGSARIGDLSAAANENDVVRITIAKPFAVSKYEVTQREWSAIWDWNPSVHQGDSLPVEGMRWEQAQLFVYHLSVKTGKRYRLLSEGEWEYAARAGTETKYAWGDDFDPAMANNGWETVEVGRYPPNAFGLHDMLGNVGEWVEDCWAASLADIPADGSVRKTGNCVYRVYRGGSILSAPEQLRAIARFPARTTRGFGSVGIRLARDL